MDKIYFDNGSTSFPKAPGVAETVCQILTGGSYNINRGGYEASYALSDGVLSTREALCRLFNFNKPRNVIFTQNITYALNMVLKGFLKPGDHIVTTSMEHNAVMRPLVQMTAQGITYSTAKGDHMGEVHSKTIESLIQPNTKAVVMLHASNVCGTVNNIEEIGSVCRKHNIFFICDCAQTAGVVPIDMEKSNISALCFTGHKSLLGPQGSGGFLVTPALEGLISPLIAGGTGSVSDSLDMPHTMPDKFEAGTMNLPAILGLGAALSYLETTKIATIFAHEMEITKYFLSCAKTLTNAKIVGRGDIANRTAVVSLDFPSHDNGTIAYLLDDRFGIMTRCGMHCAPSAHRTLNTFPQGTVRFSFGYTSTKQQVDYCIEALSELLK